jgi:hypothetical protein
MWLYAYKHLIPQFLIQKHQVPLPFIERVSGRRVLSTKHSPTRHTSEVFMPITAYNMQWHINEFYSRICQHHITYSIDILIFTASFLETRWLCQHLSQQDATLFKVWGCWMLKKRAAQKIRNGRTARVTAAPTLIYATLLSTHTNSCHYVLLTLHM